MNEQIKEAKEQSWSLNGEEYAWDSLAELINEEDVKEGDVVWRGTPCRPDPAEYIEAHDVIDCIAERGFEDAGEFAEGYPNVSEEARNQLEALLSAWAREHCQPSFFLIEDGAKYTVTAEDVAAAKGSSSDE